MNQTSIETVLTMVKFDLGITNTTAYDARLTQYINSGLAYAKEEGIELGDTVGDMEIATMYAVWLFNKRKTGEGMPRMLRYALNNRIFADKMKEN
jgi:hypothetical protein